MSYPVNLEALPGEVLQEVFTPENIRGRRSVNSLTQLTFPKSRSALWDGTPAGEKLRLQLCSHRKPRVVLLEKALRLAQRHARHSNKPRLQCFFLGSVSVNEDEEGVTVTLDRFDPGREHAGIADRVPSALLPGDLLVSCVFYLSEMTPDAVVQSEPELHYCFKALHQAVSSRQTLDLSQLLKIRAHFLCRRQAEAAAFSLSWLAVCPAVSVDVQPIRAVPIIPTALLRSLTSIGRLAQHAARQRGFLTMDQTRKLVLLLESDPKASSLPIVGLWLSGVTHVYNPQVWAWTLRFMFASGLQDRVLSEIGCFLLVVFGSTHRAPQFFQCRESRSGSEPQLDFQLLTASQSVTLYQVAPVDGRSLRCELESEERSRQGEVFRAAQSSFNRRPPPTAGLSVSDQDSGVEDEDFSPRPSPSPHPPAPQARRVQPSVPELSLLIEGSFSTNHSWDVGSAQTLPQGNRKPASITSTSAPRPAPAAPPHLHSTPNFNLQQPCSCCSAHTYNCTSIFPSPAAPPHFHQQTPVNLQSAPPPPSSCNFAPPPCSNQRASPLLSSSSQHYTPKRPSTPLSSSQQQTPPFTRPSAPPPSTKRPSTSPMPPASPHQRTPPSIDSAPPSSHKQTAPLYACHSAPPPLYPYKQTPPLSSFQCASPPPHQQTSAPSCSHQHPDPPPPSFHQCAFSPPSSSPSCPLPSPSHAPALQPAPSDLQPTNYNAPPSPSWYEDSPAADPVSPSLIPRPPCGNPCCEKVGGVLTFDTYQLLLHQDHQLRLLQAQVQMLLEAQGKLQSSNQEVNSQPPKTTASIAVGTGASLFWGQSPDQPVLQGKREAQPSYQKPKPSPRSPTSSSSSTSTSSHDLLVLKPEQGDVTHQATSFSSCDPHSGPQSPVLGESASMYDPPEEQQSFYQNLMTQLSSRLQESETKQEAEEEDPRATSPSASDHSQSSQRSSSERKQKKATSPEAGGVMRATLRRLQQLGVSVDGDNLTAFDDNHIRAVETASTLASINPAAVVSRLSVSEPTVSALFPGGSVDLSLEANAIALRYLSESQLSKLSLGGHAPQNIPVPASSGESLLSPSNMSLATRKYMRRYGLIEEDGEEEEDQKEVRVQDLRRPLTEALNEKLLPQSQLIRNMRPKMQLLAANFGRDLEDKENRSVRRPLVRSSRQPEGSVGNILDLSRLRQLPKLF